MKVGFTGTQRGMTTRQRWELRDLLIELQATELHHGDCVGADAEAHSIAKLLGLRIVIHPPESDKKRAFCEGYDEIRLPLPYPMRNANIVTDTECLVGGPDTNVEKVRSGTWSTIRRARVLGRPQYIVCPDGKILKEGVV